MKYAFNTWAYSSFPVWLPAYPLDEAIRRIAEIGYYITMEIGLDSRLSNPDHIARTALNYLSGVEIQLG